LTPQSGNWYTSRAIRKLPSVLLLAAIVSACSGYHPAPVARRGGELVVALGQDAQSLNPLVAGDVWSVRALTPLYPQLYEAGADLSVHPSLAAGLPEISKDGLTWTVTLRSARWSNGRPITAEDVVYTIKTEMDPTLDTRASFDWSPLQSVEKVDASTVRFHLSRADGAFLGNRLLAPIVPAESLATVSLQSMSSAIFSTQPPVAGGPFVLKQRSPGQSLELAPNPHYFGGKPNFDQVTMLVIGDQNALETQIAQGNVTWAPDIPAAVAAQLKGVPNVTVRSFRQLGRFALVFNARPGRPFMDSTSRTALASALNSQKIATAAGGIPIPSRTGGASSIQSAGELLIPLGDQSRAAAAAEVVREAAAVGATLTTKAVAPGEFAARLRSGDFDSALAGLGEGVDPDPQATAASWETPAADPHGQNFSGLADRQLDVLLKQDLALPPWDRAARQPVLDQISARIAADAPYVDLWAVNELDAFSGTLTGVGAVGPQLDQDLQSSFYARWSLSG